MMPRASKLGASHPPHGHWRQPTGGISPLSTLPSVRHGRSGSPGANLISGRNAIAGRRGSACWALAWATCATIAVATASRWPASRNTVRCRSCAALSPPAAGRRPPLRRRLTLPSRVRSKLCLFQQTSAPAAAVSSNLQSGHRSSQWPGRGWSDHVDPADISLVLDLGCGTGRFSEMLAAELRAPVIGLDPSKKMIDQARRKSAASPVVFGRASAHELPLPEGCVDLVFMSQIYHHLRDPPAAVRECPGVS